jgi:hypothetical protein
MAVFFDILSERMTGCADCETVRRYQRHDPLVLSETKKDNSNDKSNAYKYSFKDASANEVRRSVLRCLLINRAIGLYPQVENELSLSTLPSGKKAVMRAKNKLCEINQCIIPEETYSGMPYLSGSDMK